MGMIQGIDGSALLAAFRQGRTDRSADDKARKADERQAAISGVMGQLFGGQGSGGVAGQYAPSRPAPPAMEVPGSFMPNPMDAPQMAPQAAQQAPVPQMARQASPRPDPMQLARLIALDPETGGQIASAFKTMDEAALKQAAAKNDIMGSAASFIAQGRTPQERMQRFQQAAPQLSAVGWTAEELDGIDNDLSDTALQGFQALAIAYDNKIDNELREREFQAGRTVPVTDGGNVAIIKPDGSARWAVGGGEQGAPAPSNIPADAVAALRAGQGSPEQFDEIFGPGSAARVMGGGASNGTGNFPSGQ